MAVPKVLILKAAGVNCDEETAYAFESAGGRTDLVHINQLTKREKRLRDYQILALCGGFSYGDDAGAGKILANELKYHLLEELKDFISAGNLIIGICNGFQVLVKAGILPGRESCLQEATLAVNDSCVFEDRWVYLKSQRPKASTSYPNGHRQVNCIWTRGLGEIICLPVAHGEGKFIPLNEEVLERMKMAGQIVFRYCGSRGEPAGYPANPNGSIENIAGICDQTGRILGLMPHPERHLSGSRHPRWTREGLKRHGDGFAIFANAVKYIKNS